MIYVHAGWPKTGTTSLQAALARNRDRLAAAGVAYPDRWLDGSSHNGIARMLYEEAGLDRAIAEFGDCLEGHIGMDLLLSSESLFFLLRRAETRARLLGLLDAAGRVAPVTVVWTLRRVDDMVRSLYRHLTIAGTPLPAPATLADRFNPHTYLEGFLAVERAVSRVAYVEYDPEGGHNRELLNAFGLTVADAEAIEGDLRAASRLNVGLSEKQAAVVLNFDALAARSRGLPERSALVQAFRRGERAFDDDRPWSPIDDAVGWRMHEKMLRGSRDVGFEPYLRFFREPSAACG